MISRPFCPATEDQLTPIQTAYPGIYVTQHLQCGLPLEKSDTYTKKNAGVILLAAQVTQPLQRNRPGYLEGT
jgi:hypothetical protein